MILSFQRLKDLLFMRLVTKSFYWQSYEGLGTVANNDTVRDIAGI